MTVLDRGPSWQDGEGSVARVKRERENRCMRRAGRTPVTVTHDVPEAHLVRANAEEGVGKHRGRGTKAPKLSQLLEDSGSLFAARIGIGCV